LNYKERSALVRRIVTGRFRCFVKFHGSPYEVMFQDPTVDLLEESDWIYKRYNDKLVEEADIFTLEQSYQILRDQGKWNDSMEKEFEAIQADILSLTKGLNKIRFNKAATRATKKTIEQGKKRLEELYMIKNQLRTSTIEFMSERTRQRFLVSKITSIPSDAELLSSHAFIDALVVYYFEESGIAESKIRELARTDPWRTFWATAKDTGTPLFPHSSVEMSELQQALVNWTRVYDFAYASTNRPTEDVILDDDQFDSWYQEECDRLEREINQQSVGNEFASGSEVYIPCDQEGAKEVYALNNEIQRGKIKTREQYIQEKGEVKEQALPDVRQQLQMEMNKAGMQAVKV
jgi:hypothetical protein